MGIRCSILRPSERSCRILLLGLDEAGKTTILYRWKLNERVTTIPTIGFNVETVTTVPGFPFTIWDVGGQKKIRALWKHYFNETEGILFVVDSGDKERAIEARDELYKIITDNDMTANVPLVIIANKQDQPAAMSLSELVDLLDLQKLPGNPWHIQGACALNADGLDESLGALARMVKQYRKDHGLSRFRRAVNSTKVTCKRTTCKEIMNNLHNLASAIRAFSIFKRRSPSRILMLGLDAAGKTAILYRWKLNELVRTIPTIGFNVETVTPVSGASFVVWDCGGGEKIRPLRRHYCKGTEGIVLVVDSTDKERMVEARQDELDYMITDDNMIPQVPILVIANKQDLTGAVSPSELVELLDLQKLPGNLWHIQGASALTGDGLNEAATELVKMLKQYRKDHGR